jgi:uncharacterized protein YggT (Ycf19 family)
VTTGAAFPSGGRWPKEVHVGRNTTARMWSIGRGIGYLVYGVFLIYVVILSIAFVLRLLGANPEADFAAWVYRSSDRIMDPFRGIFPTTELRDQSVFDASLLFAIVVYAILGVCVGEGVDWASSRLDRLRWAEAQQRYAATAAASPSGGPRVTIDHQTIDHQ